MVVPYQHGSWLYFGMTTLQAEWRRLYLPEQTAALPPADETPPLITADGQVRAMVLELARPADWAVLSTVWQRVQTELELPAPGIAITGKDGYQLWFSLAEQAPLAQVQQFLESIRLRYMGEIAPQRIRLLPSATEHAQMVPALQSDTGMWSAFVAPDLAAIFADSPGLDVCPSPEAQAKVLSALASIKPTVFTNVMRRFAPTAALRAGATPNHQNQGPTGVSGQSTVPRRFLQDVMNDPNVAMQLRIEAAKALLPFS